MLSLEITSHTHTPSLTECPLGRTERGATLRRQTAALEAGGVGRLGATLSMGGFTGGCCGFVERCVIAATARICRGRSMSEERK